MKGMRMELFLNTLDYYGCFSRLWVSRCYWVKLCLSVNSLRLYLCTMPPVPMPSLLPGLPISVG